MQRLFHAGSGLLLCVLAGCQSYAPYGPGYMNGGYAVAPTYAPTYGSAPVGRTYLQPQPMYTTPGGRQAPLPSAPLYTPRNAPVPSGMQPIPSGQNGYQPSAAVPKTVPQPVEAGPARMNGDEAPLPSIGLPPGGSSNSSPLGADPGDDAAEFAKPVGALPVDEELKSTALPEDPSATIRKKLGPATFKGPTSLPGGKAKGASFESSTADPPQLNPYGFDRKAYTWLRGTLDYDQTDKKWHITYSTLNSEPGERDSYGGALTLSPDNRLEEYLSSDVVLVEGSIDASQRDRFGKPMYRLNKIVRLQDPKTLTTETADAN